MMTIAPDPLRTRISTARALMIGGLLAACLPGSASADAIYTYQGNDYALCGGIYCTGGPYSLSVTFQTTLTDIGQANLPFTNITSTVTSFAFTDGTGLRRDDSNTPPGQFEFSIATDSEGGIIAWFVGAYTLPATTQMQSNWMSPIGFSFGADFSETTPQFAGDFGFILNDPGVWTERAVPEPAIVALMLTSLAIRRGLRSR